MVKDKKNNQFYSLSSKLMDILSSDKEDKDVESVEKQIEFLNTRKGFE